MRRIKWVNKEENKDDSESDDDNEEEKKTELKSTEHCALVWEGTVQKRFFDKWKVVEVRNEHDAVRALADRGCEHYWRTTVNHKIE